MLNHPAIIEFEKRLTELGCAAALARRNARELADHFEDLQRHAMEEGMPEAQAAARALERLGDPKALAERMAAALRQSSWWGRHPLLGFCLVPWLGLAFGMMLVPVVLLQLMENCLPAGLWAFVSNSGQGSPFLYGIMEGSSYAYLFAALALFGWLVPRTILGMKWFLLICALGSLQSGFLRMLVQPHSVIVGYGLTPNWISALWPLLFGAAFIVRQRWIRERLKIPAKAYAITALALASTLTGCATGPEKPPRERGWIGGEYKVAVGGTWKGILGESSDWKTFDPDIPETITRAHLSPIKIVALRTNTPAYAAGLRPGDLIVAVDHAPVKRLQDFRNIVDHRRPGTSLAIRAYHAGQPVEFDVAVGRESYRKLGTFGLSLLPVAQPWRVIPDPGFSFVFLGWEPNHGLREDMTSTRPASYRDSGAWLAVFNISTSTKVISQTNVALASATH